jgi:S-adenosylmethionine:tRNA ribosyltransferase-isomerase
MHPKDLSIDDFTYVLPIEKIDHYPLEERDASKLLIYNNGVISESTYKNLATHIPNNSFLVFNNTKVIESRLLFTKDTGGIVEIFCLEPYEEINDYSIVLGKTQSVRFKCMIGGASKWKAGPLTATIEAENNLIEAIDIKLQATLIKKLPDAYVVEFKWQPSHYSFADILALFGAIPLPPYIKRKATENDKERYQTIFAKEKGSVAAPTAGLHFTQHIFNQFAANNISHTKVTLHVGAGTFKPVKAAQMQHHEMHSEWIDVSLESIEQLIKNCNTQIIAVGTTALRTIETLYWMGIKAANNHTNDVGSISINQWDVYEEPLLNTMIMAADALQQLANWMKRNKMQHLIAATQILIAPGYPYKIVKAIITNFHQPQSTLLLLVAAAIGDDWKKVYTYALENNFRFLSYGDGSLLFLPTKE